ncbi:NAD(P)/FAD-dependent oxidoreductase [Lutibaculum baratangense]|uniref:Aminobutyraldehyde dehydrogenase n=1 Tax=Lutibaculum baratangense AMV1 TaxID=631454 RepID=V4TD29_9HYPH|nr:NAD(P)/FAD-dependent oxidoreductase [Lutibaculum baratangense]ESR24208.1 Aminobutyraldehyde dehydrogenase [Lutibaculum baratangense AMV1]
MERLDTVVIGGGVVGLAVAAGLARRGREVVLLEATRELGSGTSSRNSEVIHAGIYYPTGSLKARLCVEGARRLYDWCDTHGVPTRRVGKLIVATDEAEARALAALRAKAAENGVDLRPLSAAEARTLEPEITCVAALHSPNTGIVDSHALMLSFQGELEDRGGSVAFGAEVLGGGAAEGDMVRVHVGGADELTLAARTVVNCSGLWAQRVSAAFGARNIPELHLAKGNYFGLSGKPPFRGLVYPMPVDGGLGVHYTVDMAGQGRFGPDVEWLDHDDPARIDYAVDPSRGDGFYAAIRRYWPGLPDASLVPAYSGVRPKVGARGGPAGDFLLHGPRETGLPGYISLYGIESPGLTSSLAIAARVGDLTGA